MNKTLLFRLCLTLVSIVLCARCGSGQEQQPSDEQLDFFERKVRPLLADNCYSCHSLEAQKDKGGLLLDSRSAILNGGDSGEAIVPGEPDESLLISAVRYEDYEMPPKGQLADDEIAVLEKWVKMGAPWPKEEAKPKGPALAAFDLETRRKEHWVWQPVKEQAIPDVTSQRWSENPIDSFIYSKLDSKGLNPSDRAEPLAIARRLHMDLIGLPPTIDELAKFEEDLKRGREQATEKLVDRLLASPHFGERWGRHWLDLTRYAESRGHEFDNDIPHAFQYRDYVIRALNADVPYDQFVREHIAGDLLEKPRLHPQEKYNESILGTGFWFLGEWVHSPVDIRKDESDRFDNMIDVATKSFLGVTVSCARCHDHKFDAISTADYYSLTGFLHSSDYRQVRFESLEQNKKVAAQLDKVNQKYQNQILKLLDERDIKLPSQISSLADERIVFDFSKLPQTEYLQDGFIFGQKPARAGLPYFRSESGSQDVAVARYDAAINDPIWDQLHSISEGVFQDRNKLSKIPRSGRTLRSPTFELSDGNVSCLVSGKGHVIACVDSHRLVNGPLHGQTIKAFETSSSQWVQLNLERYIGHRLHLEFIPAEKQQIAVRLVGQGLGDSDQKQIAQALALRDQGYFDFAAKAEALLQSKRPATSRVVFEDFENGYGEWIAEGEAFGEQPQTLETIADYQGKINCVDERFVNSHNVRRFKNLSRKEKAAKADALTGRLTSPEFKIEFDAIQFMIGGGAHKDKTCVNLIVDGNVELSATGKSNNQMALNTWDVSHLKGKVAKIQVVDDHTKGWGNIGIDQVVFLSSGKSETPDADADIAIAQVVEQWKDERDRLEKQIVTKSRLAPAMLDGTGEDANIYIRGNASKFGDVEPRHFLTAVDGGDPMKIGRGSGRLALAERINDPSNPLTSRVIVNRIWHHLMGRGIVPTTDDFGVLGQRPTHPMLLDHLASEFISDGRSIKQTIKKIVLTQTYQMASRPVQESLDADPKNLLWHHRPPRRLEGEVIRDLLLALSDELDKTQFGVPVPIHLTNFMDGRGRPKKSGPLDGDGRRSIYISVRRNFISPFMLAFDTPVPFSSMGRRNVSNVPAQALILMNDPFVAAQARKWAARSLEIEGGTKARINWMYQSAFGRLPTEPELKTAARFVANENDLKTWANFAHALINTKEFIYLR